MGQENWGKPEGDEGIITPDQQKEKGGEGALAEKENVQPMLAEISAEAKANIEVMPVSPEKKETMLDMIDQKTEAILRFSVAFIAAHPNITLAAISVASFYYLSEVSGPNLIHTQSSHWVAPNPDFGISGGLVNEHSAAEIQRANDSFFYNAFIAAASGLTAIVGAAKGGWDAVSKGVAEIRNPQEA